MHWGNGGIDSHNEFGANLVGRPQVGKLRKRWDFNIKMNPMDTGYEYGRCWNWPRVLFNDDLCY
jgi:hypothetical protein